MAELICTSCKTRADNNIGKTKFKCPNCGEFEIVRCLNCRQIGAKYKCEKCGFEGPI